MADPRITDNPRAIVLANAIGNLCDGEDLSDAGNALSAVLTKVVVQAAPSQADAEKSIQAIADEMIQSIRKNWPTIKR